MRASPPGHVTDSSPGTIPHGAGANLPNPLPPHFLLNQQINWWAGRKSRKAYSGTLPVKREVYGNDKFQYRNTAERNAVMLYEGSPEVAAWAKAPAEHKLRWFDRAGYRYDTRVSFEVEYKARAGLLTLVVFVPPRVDVWAFRKDVARSLRPPEQDLGPRSDYYRPDFFRRLDRRRWPYRARLEGEVRSHLRRRDPDDLGREAQARKPRAHARDAHEGPRRQESPMPVAQLLALGRWVRWSDKTWKVIDHPTGGVVLYRFQEGEGRTIFYPLDDAATALSAGDMRHCSSMTPCEVSASASGRAASGRGSRNTASARSSAA